MSLAPTASGCGTSLPSCDEPALAREVYYAADGSPAYGGQALLLTSCGTGTCHDSTAAGAARYGAPAGFDFDVVLASSADDAAGLARLARAARRVREEDAEIYAAVESDEMPPKGDVLFEALAARPRFGRGRGPATEALPPIDSAAGLALLGRWLACGAPVVERVGDGGSGSVGDIVPREADDAFDETSGL